MAIGNRLKHIIDYRHTNVNHVAEKIGVKPQTLYEIIYRDNEKVDINILTALSHALEVRLEFFAKDSLTDNDLNEEIVLNRYCKLDEHGRKIIRKLIDLELKRIET